MDPTKRNQMCSSCQVWFDRKSCIVDDFNYLQALFTSRAVQLLGVIRAAMKTSAVPLITIFIFIHEAFLMADLASEEKRTFWTWVVYLITAAISLKIPLLIMDAKQPDPEFYEFIWLAYHSIATLASTFGYFINSVNISNIVPSMILGKVLALWIPLPAKELSILGTAAIIIWLYLLRYLKA